MAIQDICWLCGQNTKWQSFGGGARIECGRCGTYEAAGTLMSVWEANPSTKRLRSYLACRVRQNPEGSPIPRFYEYDWESIAQRHEDVSPMRKADVALAYIVRTSQASVDDGHVTIGLDQGLHFDAVSKGQVEQVLEHLLQQGLVKPRSPDAPVLSTTQGKAYLRPTLKGAQHYWIGGDPIKSPMCFVAMSFDDDLAYILDEAIKPAAKECGYGADRVDLREFNGEITDEIMAGIRRSRFLIADFTGHKGGVYFEAGFALGLGREVIFTCKKDELQGCHFDTKHYKHIDWVDAEDLRKRLISRIMGTIGPPVRD